VEQTFAAGQTLGYPAKPTDEMNATFLGDSAVCVSWVVAPQLQPALAMPLADAILVVDDDADTREMLVEYLLVKGFTVHAAPNGATALVLADALRPRVILMDLSMPHLSGLETTRRLRANASIDGATIVAVTARVFAADRDAARRAGCDFFVAKPYDLAALATFIDGVFHTSPARPPIASRLPPKSAPQAT
jgi:CheY-like chemotaxis protein